MEATNTGLLIPHVLVVEDHADERDFYQYVLTRQGCRISEAVDGFEALASIEADSPDLILTDVGLPSMDGFEFCEILRGARATSEIPLILITDLPNSADVAHLAANCGARVLRKPCSPMTLTTAVEKTLQANARLRRLAKSAAVRARIIRRRPAAVPHGSGDHPRARLHRRPQQWRLLLDVAARHFLAHPGLRVTASQAALIWDVTPALARLTCECLCRRGLLIMSSTGVFAQRAGVQVGDLEHGCP
jgi:CheY-like chemotaxis protein